MAVGVLPAAKEDLVGRLRTLYGLARQHKRSYYDTWVRNYRLVNNKVGGRASSSWAPAPRDSEIYPIISSLVGWMADQNTSVSVTAAADPHSPYSAFMQKVAQDLGTTLNTNWIINDHRTQVKLDLWDGFLYGTGFFKAVWDQQLAGGLGDAILKRVDPWALYIDPEATCLADAEYIIEARRMSYEEIERRWPDTAHLVRDSETGSTAELDESPTRTTQTSRTPMANPGALPSGDARWSGARSGPTDSLTPSIVVYEFWVKENSEWWQSKEKPDEITPYGERHIFERWRVVVVAASRVLMDDYADDLWSHAGHPYEDYRPDDTGELYGISLVDHLAHPQIYINRLLTAMQHNAELVGNPIFVESSNSGLDRVGIVNKPGQRLRVNAAGMQTPPQWLTPPTMPEAVPALVDFWIGRMDNASGLSAAVKGYGNISRIPEEVMGQVQEAAFVRVRSALANLEATLTRSARKLAELIIDNYTVPRVIATIGPQGEETALALRARHFITANDKGATPLQYSLLVQAGASMPTSRQARMAEADKAYALGIIDRQAWFEAHQYPNWPSVLDRVNQAIATGQFQPPGARQRARRNQ